MIILILIILLCFNIYIKNIHSCLYTIILLFLFICHELYFYNNKENFESNIDLFKESNTIDKQKCIYNRQIKLLNPNNNFNPTCYQITDKQTCNHEENSDKCIYDNELNKCVDKNIGDNCYESSNYPSAEIKCHFMDDKKSCSNLRPKEETCNLNSVDCLKNKDCELHYYTDSYNKNKPTNIVKCCNYILLKDLHTKFYGSFPEEIELTNLNDIHNIIYESTDKEQPVEYYGLRKLDNKILLYLFYYSNSNNDQSSILNIFNDSASMLYNCFSNQQYLGSYTSIVIYKNKSQCINKSKCKWNETDEMCYKNMNNGDDRKGTIGQLKYGTITTST